MRVRHAFAKVLREIRTEQALTQEKLALQSGVSMQTVSLLECAKFQPSLETLFALSSALKISASSLIEAVEQNIKE